MCLILTCGIIIVCVIVVRFNTKTPPSGEVGKFKNPLKNINVIIVVVSLAFGLIQVSWLAKQMIVKVVAQCRDTLLLLLWISTVVDPGYIKCSWRTFK